MKFASLLFPSYWEYVMLALIPLWNPRLSNLLACSILWRDDEFCLFTYIWINFINLIMPVVILTSFWTIKITKSSTILSIIRELNIFCFNSIILSWFNKRVNFCIWNSDVAWSSFTTWRIIINISTSLFFINFDFMLMLSNFLRFVIRIIVFVYSFIFCNFK